MEDKLSSEDACARLFRPKNWELLREHGYSELFVKYSELEDIEDIVPQALEDALQDAENDFLSILKTISEDSRVTNDGIRRRSGLKYIHEIEQSKDK